MRLNTYALNDAAAVLGRALDVAGYADEGASGIFKSTVRSTPVCTDSIPFLRRWAKPAEKRTVEVAPLAIEYTGNTAYPRDRNNGAVWNGVGINGQASAGVTVRQGMFSVGILPTFTYQQNSDFEYGIVNRTSRSPFANPDHPNIDFPRRFGADAFTQIYPGQSFARADIGPVSVALSTENLWLGAMQVYPILLSNTAPGFPHVRIGTPKGIDLKVVNVEAQVFVGELQESEFFDGVEGNNAHVFGGTLLTIEPTFLRGLHLGIARVYHDTASFRNQSLGFFTGRIVATPFWDTGGNLASENAIGTVFLRWKHPESGFEVFGEWAREDTPFGLENLIRVGEWTQAWAAGVQKVIVSPTRLTRIYGEILHLGEASTVRVGQGYFSYYTHSRVIQGHTNRGQLLGAAVGPGGNTRVVGVDVFTADSRTSVEVEQTRYDEDTYYRQFARHWGDSRQDTELTGEVRRAQFLRDFQIEGVVRFSYRWDRDFLSARQDLPASVTETNWGTELRVRWTPRFGTGAVGADF